MEITTSVEFKRLVQERFRFLELAHSFIFTGVRVIEGDPRDSVMYCTYRQDENRIDIAWGERELSLAARIYLDAQGLTERHKYIYLEPFVEFISKGVVKPIVPQVYPQMSVRAIERVARLRAEVFSGGLGDVVAGLSGRLAGHFTTVFSSTSDTLRAYQAWYSRDCHR